MLSITDNGHGIAPGDLQILCQRFTTSKLRRYEDLLSISTYGFRGEALASLSYVSTLHITSKPKDQEMAYEAEYRNGIIVDAENPKTPDPKPKPCKGNNGTMICARNMFATVPQRKKAFNAHDEYLRILDVVQKYAIHLPHIQFTCRKVLTTNDA